ncbi:MAG: glycoside hydrolase family 15 protein [Parcubacteria group bacterium]|jgi:GH15 family glucan-1,4-alpha-glucosidase|nr:glycoside hydrolase family 15 protein [Parcubacteria group bacterium]
MARSMVLGNGNTMVCLDQFGQVRDFYFPYVGQDNHIGSNQMHKIGVFVNNGMHWIDNGEWDVDIRFEKASMVSKMRASNERAKILIESNDVVYNEKNIFLRKINVTNLDVKERDVRVFLNQQFKIGNNNHADTAYFLSSIGSIIHYKGRRVFLVGGICDNKNFDDFGIGFCGIEGKQGTWVDAEDGILSKNPIEHGRVDSVVGWQRNVPAGSTITIYYWIMVGETYKDVCELLSYTLNKTPEHLLESTTDFWRAWTGQVEIDFPGLSEKAKNLFYDSLLVIRAHCDEGGGILASADSGNVQYGGDTYAYVWPRDAGLIASCLDLAGFYNVSRRFYVFANDILTEEGYVLHKYHPDHSLGSSWHPWVKDGKRQLAIQEDETAVLLFGLWEHYVRAKDLEFIESVYNSFIKKSADFMVRYRDFNTGLPLPSYDLWEERYGVSTYTTSLVYGALMAAYNFARTLGKEGDADKFYSEAESVRKALINYLWNDQGKHFFKLIDDSFNKDYNLDVSSFYGVFKFGVIAADDPRMKEAFKVLIERVGRNINIGGVARYEGDRYHHVGGEATGNPWFVTTLWLTQYKIAIANSIQDLQESAKDIEWAAKFAQGSMLAEQLNPYTGEPLSANPLTWSHAEYVRTVIEYSKKMNFFSTQRCQ